jgi:hypothetical protein
MLTLKIIKIRPLVTEYTQKLDPHDLQLLPGKLAIAKFLLRYLQ